MSARCVKRSKDRRDLSGHKMRNRVLSCARANPFAKFSTKHQTPNTISFSSARGGLEQQDITGARKELYEVIKAIQPPVLVAIGECKQLKRFLVCTGGKEFIEQAVQFTGEIAAALGASVTLLHVMAEPPAIYVNLVQLEENVDQLLESKSELGTNLLREKKDLERLGVPAEVRLRHGIVIDQVFEEVRAGGYDLIVTGTSQARGLLGHYIMGDLTRSILNRANCPVLVARAGPAKVVRTFWKAFKGLFGRR